MRCPRCGGFVPLHDESTSQCLNCAWDADAPTREPTAAEREEAEGHAVTLADGTRVVRQRAREPRHGRLKL